MRARAGDEAPLNALHRHLREALQRRDPVTGLCDDPRVVAFHRLVTETPVLRSAVLRYVSTGEDALAAALREATPPGERFADVTARLAAGQILAVQRALGQANQAHIARGVSAEERAPDALAEADHAFDLLRGGLVAYRA